MGTRMMVALIDSPDFERRRRAPRWSSVPTHFSGLLWCHYGPSLKDAGTHIHRYLRAAQDQLTGIGKAHNWRAEVVASLMVQLSAGDPKPSLLTKSQYRSLANALSSARKTKAIDAAAIVRIAGIPRYVPAMGYHDDMDRLYCVYLVEPRVKLHEGPQTVRLDENGHTIYETGHYHLRAYDLRNEGTPASPRRRFVLVGERATRDEYLLGDCPTLQVAE